MREANEEDEFCRHNLVYENARVRGEYIWMVCVVCDECTIYLLYRTQILFSTIKVNGELYLEEYSRLFFQYGIFLVAVVAVVGPYVQLLCFVYTHTLTAARCSE